MEKAEKTKMEMFQRNSRYLPQDRKNWSWKDRRNCKGKIESESKRDTKFIEMLVQLISVVALL